LISIIVIIVFINQIGVISQKKGWKLLIKNQILTHLNLSNNAIGFDGSRFLAQALKLNSTLEFISLKLNAIDDKAGAKFFKDLTYNTNLRVLDVEANLLSTMTVRKLCLYLQGPNSLREIYMGSNNFSESDLAVIADTLPTDKSREVFKKSKFMEIRLTE
jgi:Ran GTPase-activating protein (RanGAP) involved in mRNA processing and transport